MRTLRLLVLLSSPALADISWERQQLHGDFYSEGAAIGDINGDGKPDIVAGPFWWEGPAFEKKHAYYEPKIFNINGYSDNFFAYVLDFNGDKKNDILILGFPGKEARLYLNPGTQDDKPWPMSIVADEVDNESPVFTDITGDGKPEIVCSTGGKFGWFAPDWSNPTAKWPFVAVSDDMKVAKFTHGLGVGDVNGDGKLDLLEARRWWEHKDTGLWEQHNFAAGVGGGAQMFAYDFDGNGTNDVFTSLQAHRYGVAVYLQNKPEPDKPTWKQIMLASEQPQDNDYGVVFSQPHAAALADINGDGIQDIVTGKRYWAHNGHDPDERGARVVYWYETKRDGKGVVDFIPHLIDAVSSVGVDVTVGDVNGDGLPDVVTANKSGVFVLTQKRTQAAQTAPVKLYGPGLKPQTEYAHGQSPQDALKNLQLPTGFRADLIAAEPDIVQPIAFTFDERGRIWVLEGLSYPQPRKPDEGKDRIIILEDKDGDGTYETKTVFCEGISLGSGIELGFGGVWVGAAPYLIFIPRDGDTTVPLNTPDKSHEPYKTYSKVPGLPFTAYTLLDGWGAQDTHETLNSFIWGPDGWLYGCHGVFTHSLIGKPGTADKDRIPLNAGIWRYHPVRHAFEVFAEGTSNPWGLDYDQNGEFFVTACVIPHLYHIVPGARYQRQAGQPFNPYTYDDIKTIADHAHYAGNPRPDVTFDKTTGAGVMNNDTNALGGGHAHCGLAIYQSSQFPADYRNKLIFGNLHGHRLVTDYLDPHGSTYIGKHGSDFMRSNDMNFIPVTQKVGPDGSLYVSDWSDKQVCHRGSGAVELWDRSNGRIYKVSYIGSEGVERSADIPVRNERLLAHAESGDVRADKNVRAPFPSAPFDLAKESDEDLANLAVQTENEWFSRMARRLLMEKRTARNGLQNSIPILLQAFKNPATSASRLKALWTLALVFPPDQYLQGSDFDSSRDERLIAQRLRLAATDWDFADTDIGVLIQGATKQASPIVRRELASALQRLPNDQRTPIARALLAHGEDKDDPYIPLLIWYGIEPLVGADPKAALELAKASKLPKVTEFIYRRLATEPEGRNALLRVLAGMETGENSPREPEMSNPQPKGNNPPLQGNDLQPKGNTPSLRGNDPQSQGNNPPLQGNDLQPQGNNPSLRGNDLQPQGKHPSPQGIDPQPQGKSPSPQGIDPQPQGKGPLPAFSAEERGQLLRAVVTAARSAGSQPAPADWALLSSRLRAGASPAVAALVDELAALYGDAGALSALRSKLQPASPAPDRQAALQLLVQIRDAATAPLLVGLIRSDDRALTRPAVQALATLSDPDTAALLTEKFASFDAPTKQDAINTLATTTAGAKALLTAVKAKTIPSTMLSPFLARQIAAFKNAEVDGLLRDTFGDLNAPKADLEERKNKFRALLTPALLAKADPAKGKLLFSAICGQCHQLFGEGQKVGPDLTGSNRANLDYLLDNVLDPNAVIGKDYQLNLFELKDGRVASGVVKEETPAAYRIALPGGSEQTLITAEVKSRTIAKVSTMPEGLFDSLPPDALQHLVGYLQNSAVTQTATSIPGAIEGEALKVLEIKGGQTKPQNMGGFGTQWSGKAQLWWTGAKPGNSLTISLPVENAGTYHLTAALTKARDYGIIDVTLDGKPIAIAWDGYNPLKVIHSANLDWGTHHLTAGEHRLTFTIKGAHPDAAKGYMVGLDYVKLETK